MSFDINNVSLSGNLTADAELRFTTGGTPSLRFSIAVSRSVKKGDTYEDVPMFFNIEKMGTGCDKMAPELTKGRNVSVAGQLRQDRWKDDQGNPKSKVYVWAEKLVLGRHPKNHGTSTYDPGDRTGDALKEYQDDHLNQKGEAFDDDVPF